MSFPLKLSAPVAVLAAAAVAAAGCGGSSNAGGSSGSMSTRSSSGAGGGYYGGQSLTTASATVAAKRVTITTARSAKLGRYLVDGHRRAIYLFEKDKRGSHKSTCSGACAKAWPPVVVTAKAKVAGGVHARMLTTLRRANGSKQLVYNGWPLYYFAPDKPGTTRGQGIDGFGAEWYVMSTSGHKIEHGS